MAFTETINDSKLPRFYNVMQPVGEECPNLTEECC